MRATCPSYVGAADPTLPCKRHRDRLERVRNARDALPQRARTVRVYSDAQDRSPYSSATWPAIWC
eukprot:938554-Prymnesium_polylepis.1